MFIRRIKKIPKTTWAKTITAESDRRRFEVLITGKRRGAGMDFYVNLYITEKSTDVRGMANYAVSRDVVEGVFDTGRSAMEKVSTFMKLLPQYQPLTPVRNPRRMVYGVFASGRGWKVVTRRDAARKIWESLGGVTVRQMPRDMYDDDGPWDAPSFRRDSQPVNF